jgi:FixJ family two-component response regulator
MQGFVHVVDDDASFRKAIERRLKHAGYDVATYASAEHLLDCLPSENIPSCILLDVQIPELSGPELQERLSELGSTLPIIFLTGYPDVRTTVRTIKAGAEDFLTKPVPSNKLLQAVERAIARHNAAYLVKSARAVVLARIGTLTPRERQVFELVILGKQNKQIAFALGCTERTIKAHRHSVMEKMLVQSLAELVSLAERVGVLGIANRQVPLYGDRTPPLR